MSDDLSTKFGSIIHFNAKDNFLSHLKTTCFIRYKYSGTYSNDEIKVWKLSHWFGSFYPVIHGKLKKEKGHLRLILTTRLNSFGIILCILIMGAWTYSTISGILIQENNEWTYLWKRAIVCFVIISIPIICFKLAYNYEKRQTIKEFEEILKK